MSNNTILITSRTSTIASLNVCLSPVYLVARNEFKRIVGHPLIIVISLILLTISVLNGVGQVHLLSTMENGMMPTVLTGKDIFLIVGIQGIFYNFSLYCAILAIFIGALSIGEERSSKSLSVLLMKPLYRRDVAAGKFLGNGAFLLFFIVFNILVSSLLVMIFFREPLSMPEFIVRILSYSSVLFLECILSLGITMLGGIVFKNLFTALIAAVTFYYLDWYSFLTNYLGNLAFLSPRYLYYKIIGISGVNLFDTSVGYSVWLGATLPFIVLILFEVIIIVLVDCFVFSRGDER